jgi:hypothetical protein
VCPAGYLKPNAVTWFEAIGGRPEVECYFQDAIFSLFEMLWPEPGDRIA